MQDVCPTQSLDELIVQNPYNDQPVNLLPLMEIMNQGMFIKTKGPLDIAHMLQGVQDFLSTRCVDDGQSEADLFLSELRQANHNLVTLRKVFEEMAVLAIQSKK